MGTSLVKQSILLVIIAAVCVFLATSSASPEEQKPPAPAEATAPDAAPPAEKKPDEAELAQRIAKLIEQLGDAKFDTREAAEKELVEIGDAARPALEEALKSKDQEVVARAQDALRRLARAHVTLEFVDKDGKPVAGKHVSVTFRPPYGKSGTPQPVTIDDKIPADGRLALGEFEAGHASIEVHVDGYAGQSLYPDIAGGPNTIRLTLLTGGTVTGTVFDVRNNVPVADLKIVLHTAMGGAKIEAMTDKDGTFVFEHAYPGTAVIAPYDFRTYTLATREPGKKVTVEEEKITAVRVEVLETKWFYGRITGTLVGLDGKPMSSSCRMKLNPLTPMPKIQDRRFEMMQGMHWGDQNTIDLREGGAVDVTLPVGKYDIVIYAPGCAPYKLKDIEAKGGEITKLNPIILEEGVKQKFRVLGADGKPVAKALVFATEWDGPHRTVDSIEVMNAEHRDPFHSISMAAMTDDNGVAEMDDLTEGKYAVRVYTEAGGQNDEIAVDVKRADPVPVVDIDYTKQTGMMLQVVDKDTGALLTDSYTFIELDTELSNRDMSRYMMGDKKAEPTDHIAISGMAGRGLTWPDKNGMRPVPMSWNGHKISVAIEFTRAYAGGGIFMKFPTANAAYKPAVLKIEMTPGKMTTTKVEMEKVGSGSITGQIVPGKGITLEDIDSVYVNSVRNLGMIAGTMTFQWGPKVPLDKEGNFEAKDIPEGACYISLFDKKGEFIGLFRSDIEKDKNVDVKFNLPDAGTLEGTLTDDAGNPVAGKMLVLVPARMVSFIIMDQRVMWNNQPEGFPSATTDEKGAFRFDKICEGQYVLITWEDKTFTDPKPVTIKGGEAVKLDYRLQKSLDIEVTAKVPSPDNEFERPYGAVLMYTILPDTPGVFRIVARHERPGATTENGVTVLRGIYPGKYSLIVDMGAMNGLSKTIEVTQDTKKIDVDLAPAAGQTTLSGTVKDFVYTTWVIHEVFAVGEKYCAWAPIMPDGTFKFANLQPDTYRLCTYSIDEICLNRKTPPLVKTVTVEEGKDLEGVEIP